MKRRASGPFGTLDYTLIQTTGSRMLLKVLPQGKVRLYAPKYVRLRDADAFVAAHEAEIRTMRERVDEQVREIEAAHTLREGDRLRVEGVLRTVRVQRGPLGGTLTEDELRLTVPNPEDTAMLRDAARATLTQLSARRFAEKLRLYAPKLGVRYGRVTIREQKTRWGSCSSKHNLNFNWKLIMAPPEVLEYVVIHELCHLIEFNHSARFWRLVESCMPEYEDWKKWLKIHGEELGV